MVVVDTIKAVYLACLGQLCGEEVGAREACKAAFPHTKHLVCSTYQEESAVQGWTGGKDAATGKVWPLSRSEGYEGQL